MSINNPTFKERARIITGLPGRYFVILHNDDFTPMDFVVFILCDIFHKSHSEAETIMLSIHRGEKGIAGVYTQDVAFTKAAQVEKMARCNGFPLKVTCEPEPVDLPF